MAHYHWGQNIPGYLPMADEPNTASTFDEAKRNLIADMENVADTFAPMSGPIDDWDDGSMGDAIAAAQQDLNLWSTPGTIYAASDRPHDLGLAFWITTCDDPECEVDD